MFYRRIDDLRGISGHIFCKITVQRYRTLNAVLGYALALRGGGSGA
ncbi:hypothetical protein T11_16710 [Trichinella zimbabwensis]|uniref:Uncharacterized protein n=1 Tax=Trichinella zimbabwensis TaxID=268475 RepID=A0A0V1G7W8_9BILA|nr:hypothetical protein T11_16710 [Trichinella zimbabwensis]